LKDKAELRRYPECNAYRCKIIDDEKVMKLASGKPIPIKILSHFVDP